MVNYMLDTVISAWMQQGIWQTWLCPKGAYSPKVSNPVNK